MLLFSHIGLINSICLIYSNPGNSSLWALLSRLVPQYYPRKANVSLCMHTHSKDTNTQPRKMYYTDTHLTEQPHPIMLLDSSTGRVHGFVCCIAGWSDGWPCCLSLQYDPRKGKKWLYIYNILKRLSVSSVVFSVSFFFHIINRIVWSFG